MYEDILNYLKEEPKARERRLHQRGMVNLLLQDYPELKEIPKDKLVEFCHSFESYCRIWRKVLEENPEVRGKDYDTKRIVEENYQIGLGYEPRFYQEMKEIKLFND